MSSAASGNIVAALRLALRLEYLQGDLHSRALAAGVVPSADVATYAQLGKHAAAHVAKLQALLTALGATPDAKPAFDFTAKGAFPDPFAPANYAAFKALAQAFQDLAVRTYLSMVPTVQPSADVLGAVLRMLSVEARDAAEARRMRGERGWITLANTDVTGMAAIYAGEDNLAQGAVANVAAVGMVTSTERASEAFDEPLGATQAAAIIAPFVA